MREKRAVKSIGSTSADDTSADNHVVGPEHTTTEHTSKKTLFTLLALSLIGLTASFVLLVEKIKLLEDPSYVPSCSINPVLSCGTIMKTVQAETFGFPNPILGLIGFSLLIGLLVPVFYFEPFRKYFLVLLSGSFLGLFFMLYLISQSLYVIDALCPYCMVVWIVVIMIFYLLLKENTKRKNLFFSKRFQEALSDYNSLLMLVTYLGITVLIFLRFQSYWLSLL